MKIGELADLLLRVKEALGDVEVIIRSEDTAFGKVSVKARKEVVYDFEEDEENVSTESVKAIIEVRKE